jgi:hypothetical protein
MSGPGFTVHKKFATVEQLRAEIERRIASLPSARSLNLPAIIPADRGRTTANWTLEDWLGVPADARAAIIEVIREFDVQSL